MQRTNHGDRCRPSGQSGHLNADIWEEIRWWAGAQVAKPATARGFGGGNYAGGVILSVAKGGI